MADSFKPAYLKTSQSGDLAKRVRSLQDKLSACTLCPRHCGINRIENERMYCRSGRRAIVCSYGPHFGEEAPISGKNGSGTIFFGNCNLRCVFCQNADISQYPGDFTSYEVSGPHLARLMLELQNHYHCHNINLVSPGHFAAQIAEAVHIAVPLGLNLPLVYNSNGYYDY